MKYFLFTKFNFDHFLFLSYFIVNTIKSIIDRLNKPTKDIISSFHNCYLYTLSDFLSIIPILIIKHRSKGLRNNNIKEIEEQKSETKEDLIYNEANIEIHNKNVNKINKLLIIASIPEFLAKYLHIILFSILRINNINVKTFNLNFLLIINVVSQYISSRIILHSRFYRHHYLSFVINLLFLIILVTKDIIEINKIDGEAIGKLLYVISRIFVVSFYSIEDAYAKILFSNNSFSPYEFLFYRGILVNSMALVFSIIFIFVELPDENNENSCVFTRFWKIYENKLNILIYIGLLILNFLYSVNIFFIIDRFSPSHLAMTIIIGHFGYLLNSLIIYKDIEITEFFLRLIIYFILIFASCIHNEFIVLNFCKFQKHTRLIMEREAEKDKSNFETDIRITEFIDNIDNDSNI